MKCFFTLLIAIFAFALIGPDLAQAEPKQGEGSARIREPKAGGEVTDPFVVEGRTSGVPSGYMVFLFSQEAEDRKKNGVKPGNWPHGPIKANRSFEHKLGGKRGAIWVYVIALPDERVSEIDQWQKRREDHIKRFGRTGAPFMKREELFKDALILGEFDVTVTKKGILTADYLTASTNPVAPRCG